MPQDLGLWDEADSRLARLENQVNQLLALKNVDPSFLSPTLNTDSHMGLHRLKGDTWYVAGAPYGVRSNTTIVPMEDFAYAMPILMGDPGDIDQVGIYSAQGSAVGTKARFAVYDTGDFKELKPGRLLKDFGESEDMNQAGAIHEVTCIPRFTLHRGLYWFAAVFTSPGGIGNIRGLTNTDAWGILGQDGNGDWNDPAFWWGANHTYGPWPENFPTSALDWRTGNTVAIGVRFANKT